MKMPIPIYPTRPDAAAELEMMRRAINGKITTRGPIKPIVLVIVGLSTLLAFNLIAAVYQLLTH